jgi:hypothetical protein
MRFPIFYVWECRKAERRGCTTTGRPSGFWMPPIKELHYFDKLSRTKRAAQRQKDGRDLRLIERINSLSERSYVDFENYARLFEPKGSQFSGDISPTYSMLNDEIIQRITSYFQDLKVIFLARDPVERAWSQLSMGVRRGMISSFDATDVDEVTRNLLNPGVLFTLLPEQDRSALETLCSSGPVSYLFL